MAFRWQRELPQWLILVAMFGLAANAWSSAPDSVPVHWSLAGEVDRYGSKAEGLLALPAVGLAVYLILLVMPRLVRATETQLGGLYTAARVAVLVILAAIYGLLLLQLRGVGFDMGRVVLILVGGLFIAIGIISGRVQPNALMGVRTPWTLSSRAAWDASQRLSGRLFLTSGNLFVLGGLLNLPLLAVAAAALLVVGFIGLVWYGYRVCQADPHRLPRGQTLLSGGRPGE